MEETLSLEEIKVFITKYNIQSLEDIRNHFTYNIFNQIVEICLVNSGKENDDFLDPKPLSSKLNNMSIHENVILDLISNYKEQWMFNYLFGKTSRKQIKF